MSLLIIKLVYPHYIEILVFLYLIVEYNKTQPATIETC